MATLKRQQEATDNMAGKQGWACNTEMRQSRPNTADYLTLLLFELSLLRLFLLLTYCLHIELNINLAAAAMSKHPTIKLQSIKAL